MPNAPTEFIYSDGQNVQTTGGVADRLLANGMNFASLRTNATLRKDEWEVLDTAIITIARERLNGVADLMNAGLTYNLPNGMGTLVVQHETQTEMTAAEITMDGVTQVDRDRVLFNLVSTPVPITHKDFYISARVLEASRRIGQPLDVTQAQEASRQVAETLENTLFNGASSLGPLGFGSSSATLFGYTTRTNRNTVSLTTNWDDSAASGETILADVLSMITAAHNDRHFGPYTLYIPTNYWVSLLDDFKANSDKTIIQRLLEIPSIQAIKPADKLSDDNVLLVEMSRTNVDEVVGMQPTTLQWDTHFGLNMHFKVMAIMVPRIKLDADNRSGVVHLS